MVIYVVQGECEFVSDCCFLVCFELCDMLVMVVGVVCICVIFQVDVDGLLLVSVCEQISGKEVWVEVKLLYGLSDDEIVVMFKDGFSYVVDDVQCCVLCEVQVEVQCLFEVIDVVLCEDVYLFVVIECVQVDVVIICL